MQPETWDAPFTTWSALTSSARVSWEHTRQTHWLMLTLEIRRRRVAAAFGQAVRLVLGVIGSAIGVVPIGNTGGSDISMFKRLPIAPDLQEIIDDG